MSVAAALAVGGLFGYAGYVWDPAISSAAGAAAGVGSELYTHAVLAGAYYHVRNRVYDAANGRSLEDAKRTCCRP